MGSVRIFRNPLLPFYQLTRCIHQCHSSRKHTHAELAVALVTEGASLFRFGETEYRIRKGQLVLIGPEFVHQCCPEDVDSWSFSMLYVDAAWAESNGFPACGRPCFGVRDLSPSLFQTLADFYMLLSRPEHSAEEMLLFILDQAVAPDGDQSFRLDAPPLESEAVSRVSAYLRTHLEESVRLDLLADIAGLDKYLLIRAFSKTYDTTPHAWHLMQRMNAARSLLISGTAIAETAAAVGFYDQSHFSRLFRSSYGMTPGQFIANRADP